MFNPNNLKEIGGAVESVVVLGVLIVVVVVIGVVVTI